MYRSFAPDYALWKAEFEKAPIGKETILIGHSCGGGFLLRYLSENASLEVDKVVLIAPWLDPENKKQNNFFEFTFDPNLLDRANKFLIFVSRDDDADILKSIEIIKHHLVGVSIRYFEDKGHFTFNDLGTEAFPELLDELI